MLKGVPWECNVKKIINKTRLITKKLEESLVDIFLVQSS